MNYKTVVITRTGGPEVLQVVEKELCAPSTGEARVKVLAVSVTRPDVAVRRGESLYSGTPLVQKIPFTPGYSIIGDVDAVGEGVDSVSVGDRVGALTVTGGYSEYIEDWAVLFKLLEEGKIKPVIGGRFPILEAAKANELM